MSFDDILEQVIALLRRQGRVSYGALKRRFDLDDAYLEDLKEEILFVHPVRDDDGRGLIWIGNTEPVQAEASMLPQTPQATAAEAERRQLTVMFCDLVGSTTLSSRLDPEDYREVVRAYQATCTEVIHRYGGHVAQLLGDGLLVYFGFPVAHEEDAQRAVHSALGIVQAMGTLNASLEHARGLTLAVRLGIHTGLVVVGEMGGARRQEQLALGEVPNIAARIEGRAAPNTVAISEATFRLVQGVFDCEALGEQALRGVAEPVRVYRVVQEGAVGRFGATVTRGLTPLVGRESEVALLLERWEEAKSGRGQVVVVSGDAGIGKSRLVQVLREHIGNEAHVCWECRSSPYHQNTSLYPILDLWQRALQWQRGDSPEQRTEKLEQTLRQYRAPLAETVPLFAAILSCPLPGGRYPALEWTPQRLRQKTLDSIVAILLELAEREAVLFILEDLHWTDPSTLEFLTLLIDHVPTTSVYVVLTCRPSFHPPWSQRTYLTRMTVGRLSNRHAGQVVERVTGGRDLPPAVLEQLKEKSDGVPLYLEEMTKAALESGHLREVDGRYEMAGSQISLAIPATLQDSLMARLDRLVSAKGIAQLGAVIGRQFSFDVLRAVSRLDEMTLHRELRRLIESELVYRSGVPPRETYLFKHALVQEAAYQSLLRSTRQAYHQRIAEVLVERFPETVKSQPELPAHHFTAAGRSEEAIGYWQQAGELAVARSANQEAIHHLTRGLDLLGTLPVSPARTHHELMLLTKLGPALMAAKGYADADVEATYARARELCQQAEQTPQLFPVLWGLWLFSTARARHRTARAFGEQLLGLARHVQDPALMLEAHHALWTTLFHLGDVVRAYEHTKEGVTLYDRAHHHGHTALYGGHDPGVCGYNFGARALWLLGYPEQAVRQSRAALSLAEQLAHPFSLALARYVAAMLHQLRRDAQAVRDSAEAALAIGTAHGFPYVVALGTLLRGWALAEQGDHATGLTQMQQGLAALRATGNETFLPWCLAALAEAYGRERRVEQGLTALDEALRWVEKNEERSIEAELRRLTGEFLLAKFPGDHTEAEACFRRAISIAQSQGARSWELRAATSLARLWQRDGRRQEASALLTPVYGWFTEGFDAPNLREAKALLDELR